MLQTFRSDMPYSPEVDPTIISMPKILAFARKVISSPQVHLFPFCLNIGSRVSQQKVPWEIHFTFLSVTADLNISRFLSAYATAENCHFSSAGGSYKTSYLCSVMLWNRSSRVIGVNNRWDLEYFSHGKSAKSSIPTFFISFKDIFIACSLW